LIVSVGSTEVIATLIDTKDLLKLINHALGDLTVKIFYCRVHLLRTFMRRFKVGSAVYLAMIEALNRTTRAGCEESLIKAYKSSTDDQQVSMLHVSSTHSIVRNIFSGIGPNIQSVGECLQGNTRRYYCKLPPPMLLSRTIETSRCTSNVAMDFVPPSPPCTKCFCENCAKSRGGLWSKLPRLLPRFLSIPN
jgi:hypothetical protein